jgi:Ricin-type beta-trefoil lectin domain
MYWQQGYYWQEERIERKWCFECRSGRCGSGVEIAIRKCDSGNTRFEYVGSGQVQVKVAGQDLCLELMESNNRDIKLQKCDPGSRRQLFTAGPGDFNGSRFELQTVQVAGCLSNPHHPRDGELIRRQNCAGARFDTTSYYNKY